jgi:EAL domain-containing protein (putative c-di-GMP-specific phosphodiesterase class I)
MSVKSPPLQPAADTGPDPFEAPQRPLCYVTDEEPSVRHFIALNMLGAGINTIEFEDRPSFLKAFEDRRPDVVFMGVALDASDAMETLDALAKLNFRGAVQLMSKRAAVVERVKSSGEQKKLRMLPVLKKPFETMAVLKIIDDLHLGMPKPLAARIFLDDALANDWIEFWLEPKIDLRRKKLAGIEIYARARHPEFGVLMPSAFMPGALEASIDALAEKSVIEAITFSQTFAGMGFRMPVSLNMPISSLAKLPMSDLVRAHHVNPRSWPGIVVDIPEDQIIHDIAAASELSGKLTSCNVRMSIDNFAGGYSLLSRATELPFFEIKLSGEVTDCATSKTNASVCRSVIEFARRFGCFTAGTGLQKASDVAALVGMNCDFGQGPLMGQPMPKDRFTMLLRQRTHAPDVSAPQERQAALQPA